ncbi:glycosyltransferase family 2 protein [Hyphomicrobium sp. 802]|uniref:glycosyltransferase family 2 protein n=1 Tax=Hyphomicrobium sp. 802 TaxID=1112272 RepID=UPI00045EB87A|nr:glycosyltransferase family 2 protein [Hyphomicrobium sp. 802]
MPSISVIIPLYNHARYIGEALQSVLGQTSPVDEIIVLDDGSKDNSAAVAEAALRGQANARVIRQTNRGAHNTINRLVEDSRGDYLAILNSDDAFVPTKIERCRSLLSRTPQIELIAGKVQLMDDESRPVRSGVTVDWLERADNFFREFNLEQLAILNENSITTTSNMVFSRSLWQRCAGFQDLRYCHDLDFLMAAYNFGKVAIDRENDHIIYRLHRHNTIKEDLAAIRVEIALVIAAALHDSGTRVINDAFEAGNLHAFHRFLQNKNLTELVCTSLLWRSRFKERTEFYDFMSAPGKRQLLREFVK